MGQRYEVLIGLSLTSLERDVNHRLKNGWKLAGGVSVDGSFYQAMTKDDEVVE